MHTSLAGSKTGMFFGNDKFTSKDSERLLRLPMFYKLRIEQIENIVNEIYNFYGKKLNETKGVYIRN